MSQLRRNILNNEWSIIANKRSERPYQYGENKDDKCPFCPGNEHMTPNEILRINNENGGWSLRVVPNKFPAVKEVNEIFDRQMETFLISEKDGYHEVVIETPCHNKQLQTLSVDLIYNTFNTFKERFIGLSKLNDIKYVQIFKNCGKYGGASIPHSHSQIVALPVIPPRLRIALDVSNNYYEEKGKCLICNTIEEEIKRNIRVIYSNKSFVSCLAFAPRFKYETVIFPINHNEKFCDIDNGEMMEFADAFYNTMKMLNNYLGEFPYNYFINSAPYMYQKNYHWHMEIIPRIMHHAGMELSTDIFVNTVSPEEAAKEIRNNNKSTQ